MVPETEKIDFKPIEIPRVRRSFLGYVKIAAALLAVGGAAWAWQAGYRPPCSRRSTHPVDFVEIDRGDIDIVVVEQGTLESASNSTVRCQVEALIGTVGGAQGGTAKGSGASGGSSGQGSGSGGAGGAPGRARGRAAAVRAQTRAARARPRKKKAGSSSSVESQGAARVAGRAASSSRRLRVAVSLRPLRARVLDPRRCVRGGSSGGGGSAAVGFIRRVAAARPAGSTTVVEAGHSQLHLRGGRPHSVASCHAQGRRLDALRKRASRVKAAAVVAAVAAAAAGAAAGGGGGGGGGMGGMDEKPGSTRILEILPEGTRVKAGDIVAKLDGAAYEDEEQAQQIRYLQAKSYVEQANSLLEVSQITLREYRDGIYPQDLQLVRQYIQTCQLEKDRLAAEPRLVAGHAEEGLPHFLSGQGRSSWHSSKRISHLPKPRACSIGSSNQTGPKIIKSLEANVRAIQVRQAHAGCLLQPGGAAAQADQEEHRALHRPRTRRWHRRLREPDRSLGPRHRAHR